MFERHGVSPARVELEITETTLMLDAARTLPLLDELRAMGVHLSIDDFGTGYSSLSALQQFPIGTLKIDQSFVRDAATDPDDATIVRTIIEMGRSLGLQVVAEGIETDEQRHFLRGSGCQFGQGRLFGDPIPSDQFLEMMVRQATGRAPGPAAAGLTRRYAARRRSVPLATCSPRAARVCCRPRDVRSGVQATRIAADAARRRLARRGRRCEQAR